VGPRSQCPHCGQVIRFYDNIPLLSYLLLRGRCRRCDEAISPRYFLVEALSGIFALATLLKFGATGTALAYYAMVAVLLVVTFIDIDYQIIPDAITLPGIAVGVAISFVLPYPGWKNSLLGVVAGGGFLWLVAWGYRLFAGREGMGGGDIKLLAMLGAFLGVRGVIFTLMAAAAVGSLTGCVLILVQKKGFRFALPFGPFLAIGALLYLYWGDHLILWYLGLLR